MRCNIELIVRLFVAYQLLPYRSSTCQTGQTVGSSFLAYQTSFGFSGSCEQCPCPNENDNKCLQKSINLSGRIRFFVFCRKKIARCTQQKNNSSEFFCQDILVAKTSSFDLCDLGPCWDILRWMLKAPLLILGPTFIGIPR